MIPDIIYQIYHFYCAPHYCIGRSVSDRNRRARSVSFCRRRKGFIRFLSVSATTRRRCTIRRAVLSHAVTYLDSSSDRANVHYNDTKNNKYVETNDGRTSECARLYYYYYCIKVPLFPIINARTRVRVRVCIFHSHSHQKSSAFVRRDIRRSAIILYCIVHFRTLTTIINI